MLSKTKLKLRYNNNDDKKIEIGVDEAGRGPLFGRVYAAAVVLPSLNEDNEFDPTLLKDSKKFSSERKILEAYEHVKQHAIAYHVAFCDENEIDKLNIRRATHKAMHECIKNTIIQIQTMAPHLSSYNNYLLCIDGNDFTPYITYDKCKEQIIQYKNICIKGGDNSYSHIAAASILAKVERDKYIKNLCNENPILNEYYGISSNKGYGAKVHIDGIKKYGITQWHRKTFGICKKY